MVNVVPSKNFVERLARTLAKTDQIGFEENPERFRRLARAAVTEFQNPTPKLGFAIRAFEIASPNGADQQEH